MAWFRAMGADSVAYHKETVVGRGDDHPGRALEYYGSRGETPLRWGGALAAHLGLVGEMTPEAYEAAFGPGGFRHPLTGERLTKVKRPGFELVIGPHKSVAVLGVIGRTDDMHTMLDAETSATLAYLEAAVQERGGSRGRAQTRTPTAGLLYAVTRHGTSRLGDPHPHDHVLIVNVTVMRDAKGGPKALDSAFLRDINEAATMVGRLHAAAKAIRLGYAIEIDQGDSGRARRWRIVGIPDEVSNLFSKRADEIADYLEDQGYTGYRARTIAARTTRKVKRHTGVNELMPHWRAELEEIGWSVERLAEALDAARRHATGLLPALTQGEVDALTAELMDPEGEFLRSSKVFTRSRLVAEIAPRLYGHDPAELDRVLDRVIGSDLVVPLIGIEAAREQPYASAAVLANEQTIADAIERLVNKPGPALDEALVLNAITTKEAELGRWLTDGQRHAISGICRAGRAVDVVVGVAGSGKTTALDAATTALQEAGYTVVGTATSGQAARTLGHEANVQSRTMRSLLWRLQQGQASLDDRTIVILDEAAMTADADLARLLLAVERTGAKVVLVGDHRQLSAVGPGGALAAVLQRHPEIMTGLTQNLRQRDPAERRALAHLRAGSVESAVGYYVTHDRIQVAPTRAEALGQMVDAWAADVDVGQDALMQAWRRRNVSNLNRMARARADQLGWLTGDDLPAPGGRGYAVGDPVVLLAPNYRGELVTSQRGVVTAIDHQNQALTLLTDTGRQVTLAGAEIDDQHLDHGYAMTVHRQQGATCDRTHYFADGGGRELAYVAMSRARDRSTVHAIADDPEQAVEDITHDWSRDQHQQWVTQTAQPGIDADTDPLPEDPQARRAWLRAELERLHRTAPPDVTADLAATGMRLAKLEDDRQDLARGIGRWQQTPEGAAARQLNQATQRLDSAEAHAQQAWNPWERRRAQRDLREARNLHAHAREQWAIIGEPVAKRLDRRIGTDSRRLAELERDHRFNQQWHRENPDIARGIERTKRELQRLVDPDTARLLDQLDAATHEGADRPEVPGADDITQRLDRLQGQDGRLPDQEPPAIGL